MLVVVCGVVIRPESGLVVELQFATVTFCFLIAFALLATPLSFLK
jgi:hypothetical protein